MHKRHLTNVVLILVAGCTTTVPPEVGTQSTRDDRLSEEATVLNAVIGEVLKNPELDSIRREYTEKEEKRYALVNNPQSGLEWPRGYAPSVHGYSYEICVEGAKPQKGRAKLLGIRLDKYDPTESNAGLDGNVIVTLLRVWDQDQDAQEIKRTSVHFTVQKVRGQWSVEIAMLRDP